MNKKCTLTLQKKISISLEDFMENLNKMYKYVILKDR
jgi:hypothetical protein